jgi:hypothetical protein
LLDLMTIFALVAVVLTVSGLASGVVERTPLSFPIAFLGLGFLLAVVGVVVTVAVVARGATATPLSALYGRAVERTTLEEERESTAAGLFGKEDEGAPRISPRELAERLEGPNPPLVLDVRTRSQYERDQTRIPGSIWVMPDRVQDWATHYLAEHPDGEPHLSPIAAYCT